LFQLNILSGIAQFFENSVYPVRILGYDRVPCSNQCKVQHYPRDLSNLNRDVKNAVLLAPLLALMNI